MPLLPEPSDDAFAMPSPAADQAGAAAMVERLRWANLGPRIQAGNAAAWLVRRPGRRFVLKRLAPWSTVRAYEEPVAEALFASIGTRAATILVRPVRVAGRFCPRDANGSAFLLMQFTEATDGDLFAHWRQDADAFVWFHRALSRDFGRMAPDVRHGLLEGTVHRDLRFRVSGAPRWSPLSALLGEERSAVCAPLIALAEEMPDERLDTLCHYDVVSRNVGYRRYGAPYIFDFDDLALGTLYLDALTSGLWAGMDTARLQTGLDALAASHGRAPDRHDIAWALLHLLSRLTDEIETRDADPVPGVPDSAFVPDHHERVDRLLAIARGRGLL